MSSTLPASSGASTPHHTTKTSALHSSITKSTPAASSATPVMSATALQQNQHVPTASHTSAAAPFSSSYGSTGLGLGNMTSASCSAVKHSNVVDLMDNNENYDYSNNDGRDDGDDHSMDSDFSEITEFTSATEIKERKSTNTLVRGEHQMY